MARTTVWQDPERQAQAVAIFRRALERLDARDAREAATQEREAS